MINYFNRLLVIRLAIIKTAVGLVFIWGAPAAVAAEALVVDGYLSTEFNDNIGFAERQNDQESDWVASTGLRVSRNIVLPGRTAIQLVGAADYRQFREFDDLNRLALSAAARYVWQPGLDYTSPWFDLVAEVRDENFRDSDIREGVALVAGFSTGQRLTDRLEIVSTYRYTDFDPGEGEIFDTGQHRLMSRVELKMPFDGVIYAAASLVSGDLVSSGSGEPTIIAAAAELGPDKALRTSAWQLDGVSREIELGFSLPMAERFSLDVSVAHTDATATSSIDYRQNRVQATLLSRF